MFDDSFGLAEDNFLRPPSVALIFSIFAPFAVRFSFKFPSGIWKKDMGPSHPLPWVRVDIFHKNKLMPPGWVALIYLAEDMGLEPTGLLHLT